MPYFGEDDEHGDDDLTAEEQARWELFLDQAQREVDYATSATTAPTDDSGSTDDSESTEDEDEEDQPDAPEGLSEAPDSSGSLLEQSQVPSDVGPPEDYTEGQLESLGDPEELQQQVQDEIPSTDPEQSDPEVETDAPNYEQVLAEVMQEGQNWLSDVQSEVGDGYTPGDVPDATGAAIERYTEENSRSFFGG